MTTLDLRPSGLPIVTGLGAARAVVFTFPTSQAGVTYTAYLAATIDGAHLADLSVVVSTTTVTMGWTAANTVTVNTGSPIWWVLAQEGVPYLYDRFVVSTRPGVPSASAVVVTPTATNVAVTAAFTVTVGAGGLTDGDKGDITVSGSGAVWTIDSSTITSAKIVDGTIVDGDINASAAIALSKLATDPLARANHTGTQSADTLTDGTTNKAFLATERTKLAGIATGATANSPDATLLNRANHTGTQLMATISDAGALATLSAVGSAQITDGAITNADVNAAAAIAYAKLNLALGVVNADVSASAAIARSKLDFGSGLVNADLAAGAAIAYSKLALTGAILNADLAGSIALSKLATDPLARANHTGTQAESTVTNLVTDLAAKLAAASNLSDLASAATARTNLGLGSAALISSTAGGDLSGTLPSPTVAKINGITVTGTPSTGYVPTATSSSAATWQAAGGGIVVASPTIGKLNTGSYYSMGAALHSTNGMAQNSLYAIPVWWPSASSLDRLGIRIGTSAASTTVRLGIYSDTGTGYPGALLLDAGTVASTSGGMKEITVTQALSAGTLYWFVSVLQGGTGPTCGFGQQNGFAVGDSSNANMTAGALSGYIQTGVTGALPANYTATPTAQFAVAIPYVRIA